MPVDDSLDDGEADARSLEISGRMKALEGREKLVGVSHIESSTVVPDEEGPFPLGGNRLANLDSGILDLGCELPCIANHVSQRHAH